MLLYVTIRLLLSLCVFQILHRTIVPESIQYTSSGWRIELSSPSLGAQSKSEQFQITASTVNGQCEIKKLSTEMHLHDEAICKADPFIVAAGQRRVLQIKLEWLFCLDDRMRITVLHTGTGGQRTTEVSKKIGPDQSRLFSVLYSAEHGADLQIFMQNIQRQVEALVDRSSCLFSICFFFFF